MTAQQLKNSILQMAVQGKLVPQDPSDEPASVLLERIRAEKQQLIKDGKIKKEKNPSVIFRGADNLPYEKIGNNEPVCIADEVPFEIPDSWEWCRLRSIVEMNPKNLLNDNLKVGFVPMKCVSDGFRNKHTYEEKEWGDIKKGFTHFANGDIGIAKITPCFQNRKSVIFKGLPNQYGAGTTELSIIRTIGNLIIREYLFWIFKTEYFISNGKISFSGTAGQQRINKNYLSDFLVPLPPYSEQQRIVSKIEELNPIIEEYTIAEERNNKLNNEFPKALKKSILQYAVQGKLVEQDKNDEPASVLLERICAEKQKLIKEGKIKKDKHKSVIYKRYNSHYEKLDGIERCIDDEIPFDIPDNWAWCRLSSVLRFIDGEKTEEKNYPYLDAKYLRSKENPKIHNCGKLIHKNSKVILVDGENSGEVFTVFETGYIGSTFKLLEFESNMYMDYILLFILLQKNFLKKNKIGAAIPHLNKNKFFDLFFSVPPLDEQKQIVARIEKIFSQIKDL